MVYASFGRRSLCGLLLLLFGLAGRAHAQDVTEVGLKGAFLFNFARFTEWPADSLPADSTVSACVFGDRAVGDAFARQVKGKQLGGRTVNVTIVDSDSPLPACHLLYVSGISSARLGAIVSSVRESPVLTVSDAEEFTKRGGIIQFFVESGKMRFRINTRSAKRARLLLSSRLLALAEVVDEEPTSVAALSLTDFLTSAVPRLLIAPDFGRLAIDWARPFTTLEAKVK
jgi:hypothetical protein